MNVLRILAIAALAGASASCASLAARPGARDAAGSVGAIPAGSSLSLVAGAVDIRVVLSSATDSVRWTLSATPEQCARVDRGDASLTVRMVERRCHASWEITAPLMELLSVRTGVGDVRLTGPFGPALHFEADVGSVRVRLGGHDLRIEGAAGSGERLVLGDRGARPRIELRTGVGEIRAELSTPSTPSTPSPRSAP